MKRSLEKRIDPCSDANNIFTGRKTVTGQLPGSKSILSNKKSINKL